MSAARIVRVEGGEGRLVWLHRTLSVVIPERQVNIVWGGTYVERGIDRRGANPPEKMIRNHQRGWRTCVRNGLCIISSLERSISYTRCQRVCEIDLAALVKLENDEEIYMLEPVAWLCDEVLHQGQVVIQIFHL